MAHALWIAALGVVAATSPVMAASSGPTAMPSASDSADTRYCMRVEATTGTRIEMVRCWTRAEWAEQLVDVDKDWPKEGVSIRGPRASLK